MNKQADVTKIIEAGLSNLANGQYQRVHGEAIDMIQRDPYDPVPYLLLGKLSLDHHNHSKALELHQRATELAPDNAHCQVYLAQALSQLGRQAEANEVADSAASLAPGTAHLADTIGVVYSRTGFHEKAVPWFERAVASDPAPANYHYNLAASLQFLGDFKNAERAYRASLQRDPSGYRALASIVSLNKQTEQNQQTTALLEAYNRLQDDTDAALHLGHALAKTFEDLGDYETSLEWLDKAKAGKRMAQQHMPYTEMFNAAKQTVFIDSPESKDISDEAPIFVVGLPRTGTTLVDRILSSHRDVVAAGELNVFAGLVKSATKTPSNLMMDGDTFSASRAIDLAKVGVDYLSATRELRRDAPRFSDKMPLNFFYLGLINKALPNARMVALRRGSMDSCLSNYRQLLTAQYSYYNYTYDLQDTAAFYRQFDDLMTHWRNHLPADRFLEICYEDIVHDQEQQTRKLLDFCGLSWDPACMNFHQNKAPVSTASSVQVRQPLYAGSIGRWQRYGNKLDGLRKALGKLAD